jgi:SAM-dependent methyltransferase
LANHVAIPAHLAANAADVAFVTELRALEEERERRWQQRYFNGVRLKLHWRASVIRQTLNLLPGESILEFGAGSGLLTGQMDAVLEGANPITAIVFSPDLLERAWERDLRNARFVFGEDLDHLPTAAFDYIVGSGMLWHSHLSECLRWLHVLLKPGGQLLFFEPNYAFPTRLFNEMRYRRSDRNIHLGEHLVLSDCSEAKFTEVDLAPHDMVSTHLGVRQMEHLQAKAILLEHAPVFRSCCASIRLLARKPGLRTRPTPNLATHSTLAKAVSIVIPARNEAANIPGLVQSLLNFYEPYIQEIVIVNDGSTDDTEAILCELSAADSRIRPVNRSAPNGVGLSLRDGYRAATGRYILSMDCDFVDLLPQLRGLFQAIAEGHDGAIGSRFSHDSILVNYPFAKLIFNRLCHLLIKLFFFSTARDVTNNLKLYRSEILKNLDIRSTHFSVNLETGLKPLLEGHDIIEVPISWVNRTPEMGSSSFSVRRVGGAYATTLFSFWRSAGLRRGRGIVQNFVRRLVPSHFQRHSISA